MIIEANENFTQEDIDDVFQISINRLRLYKDPSKKLPNAFKEAYRNLISGIVLLTVTGILGILTRFNVIDVIAITLSAILLFVSILWLVILKKSYKDSKAQYEKKDPRSKIEVTEEFIAVEKDDESKVKIKWSDIGFIKVFNATVGVFSSDKTRALIIPLKYWNQIAEFMNEKAILVKFYN